ncbi:MAG: hypothetical protein KGI71_04350 [Patescibacteria group bacterium]|nr:hypothetical protein [Patescibacteria group bacterium]
MPEEQSTTPNVTQSNDQSARTETGEIKDQQGTQATTTETKSTPETSTETKSDQQASKTETKTEPGKVPDKYEFKAPEGFEIDAKAIEEATPVFKELGLTQDQGQKLFDLYTKFASESAEAPYKQYETMRNDWRSQIAKNPELGDGKDNLSDSAKANIARAIDSVGDAKDVSALKEALDITGAGDNPAIVAAFNTLGKLLSEGTPVKAGAPAPVKAPGSGPRTAASAIYPNLPSANS